MGRVEQVAPPHVIQDRIVPIIWNGLDYSLSSFKIAVTKPFTDNIVRGDRRQPVPLQ